MCTVCLDWIKGNLTLNEAIRNLGEMVDATQDFEEHNHYSKTLEKLKKLSGVEDDLT